MAVVLASIPSAVTTFAEAFEERMRARDLTEVEASKLLGVSQATVNRWRRGKTVPGEDSVRVVAKFLGTTIGAVRVLLDVRGPALLPSDGETLPDLLAAVEREQRWSKIEAVRATGVGLDAYKRWRRGQQVPYLRDLPELAKLLDVSEERLLWAVYRTELARP